MQKLEVEVIIVNDDVKKIIEAMLFASGREIEEKEFLMALELGKEEFENIISTMQKEYENRGIELIKVNNKYQLCTKKEYYEYIYPLFDNRSKPSLSNPAMETLSIIAYNPKITRAEIESIRGVGSDGTIYKLLEYNLIEEAGRLDAPGRPTMYKVTSHFLKTFGLESIKDLPELPRFKLDENEQIVLDEFRDDYEKEDKEEQQEQEEKTDNED